MGIHILVSLELSGSLNSEQLAWSTGTNASMVRRVLSMLARAGLVTSQAGARGGASLARSAKQISLLEVFDAVELKPTVSMHEANPKCPLGNVVDQPIGAILQEANESSRAVYERTSLAEIAAETGQLIVRARKRDGG
jgi:Rrf2 family protein